MRATSTWSSTSSEELSTSQTYYDGSTGTRSLLRTRADPQYWQQLQYGLPQIYHLEDGTPIWMSQPLLHLKED